MAEANHAHGNHDNQNPEQARAHLWELIKDIHFGMLAHRHGDGALHSHPLTTLNKSLDEAHTLYFFVPKDGEIATRVAADGNVNVSYAHPGKDSYVSVSGRGRLTQYRDRIAQLWTPAAKAYFPQGQDDPNLAVLEVEIAEAEYWDVKENKMAQLWKLARAAATGQPPRGLGEHAVVKP